MKKIVTFILFFCVLIVQSQNYTMPTTGNVIYNVCSGTFTDSGGANGNYGNNQNSTVTFCPSTTGNKIRIEFQQFLLEAADINSCFDYIEVFQGNSATGPSQILCGSINNLILQSTEINGCLTIRFVSNNEISMVGWNASVSCVVSNCTPPTARFTSSKDLICNRTAENNTDSNITFNASGSTTNVGTITEYKWNLGDGNLITTTTPTLVHNYINPGIYNVSLQVVNSNGCSSTLPAFEKIFHTNAPSFLGSTISSTTINCGETTNLIGTAKSQTIVSSPPRIIAGITNLPDGIGVSYTSSLNFTGMFEQGALVTADCLPTISFSLEHSYSGDLTIALISPNGTKVILYNHTGDGINFGTCVNGLDNGVEGCPATYIVKSNEGVPWTSTGALTYATQNCNGYNGNCESGDYYLSQTYQSYNSFTPFIGTPLNGVWVLEITDHLKSDDGHLYNWTLDFPQSCYPNAEQYTPKITDLVWSGPNLPAYTNTNTTINNPGPGCPDGLTCVGNQLSNSVLVGPFNTPGTYTYNLTATDEFGCDYTKTHVITVQAPRITSLTYPLSTFCTDDTNQTPTLLGSGDLSGLYTSTPTGLSIDSQTGVINPGGSSPGQYTVTFTTNCGNVSRSTNLTVLEPSVPTFTPIVPVCFGENIILPTVSNNNITGIWSPAINNTATTTYTFTPNPNQCADPVIMTVSVKPRPVVVATPSSEILCSGTSTNIALSSTTAGATYSWTVVQNGVIGASSGTGNTISQALTTTGSNAGTAVYTITPTANGCVGEPITVTITVNAIPVAIVTPVSQTLCSGSTTNIGLSSATTGTTYSWTVVQNGVSGATAGAGSTITQTLTATGSNAGTAIYTITPTANGCVGESMTVTITVNAIPVAIVTPVSQTLCSGSTTNIGLSSATTGTTYSWTVIQNGVSGATAGTGNTISQPLTATGSNAGTVVYTITPSANGCVGDPITVTITVNAIPVVVATPTSEILCSGTSTDIALSSSTTGTTYTWTVVQNGVIGASSGTGNTISQALTTTGSNAGTAVYTITPRANGCVGEPITVTITVNAIPVAIVTPVSQTLCSGSTTNIALSSTTTGTTYSWTVVQNGVSGASSGTGNTISQALTATGSNAGTVVYTITPIANGCVGESITVTVTVNAIPIVVATPSSETLCSGSTTNIALSSTTIGTTYSWTVVQNGVIGASSGTGNIISQSLTATGSNAGTVVYTVTPTANQCVGNPIEVTITVNPLPVALATPRTQAICSGGQTNIALTSTTPGTTYTWTVVQNGVIGATAGSGNSILQALTATTSQIGTAVYTIVPVANGCTGQPIVVTIIVRPIPVVSANPSTQVFCSGGLTEIQLSSETLNTTFRWTVVQNGVSGATAGTGNTISQTLTATGSNAGTAVYTITPSANGCVGDPITVTITVSAIPVVVATPSSEILCSGTSTNIALSSATTGTTYSWTVVQNGVSGASSGTGNTISQALTTTGSNAGTVVYTITPIANGCVGEPITITITVNAIPEVIVIPASQTLCSGATTNITLSSVTTGTTYSWMVVQNGVSGATAGTGNTISQTLTATGSNAGTAVYTITPTANGCVGESITVTVTVNAIPIVVATPSSEILCSGSTTNIALSSTTIGTTYSWTVVQNGVSGATSGSGNTIAQELATTTPQIGTVVYTITPIANGCVGEPIEVTITVNPIPVAVATPLRQTLCSGDSTNIVLSSATTGTTYSWTVVQNGVIGASSGTGNIISQALTTTDSNAGTAVYTITPSANGCVGETIEVAITVNPYIIPSFELVRPICAGETLIALPTRSLNGIEGTWTPGLNNMQTTTYTFTPNVQNTGQICNAITQMTIVVNPIPVVQIQVMNNQLCSGQVTSINLTSQVPNTQFTYTVISTNVEGAAGGIGNQINHTLINNTLQEGNVVYAVTPIANNCQGETKFIEIKVNPIPVMEFSVSNTDICVGESVTASFTSTIPGTSFTWQVITSNISGAIAGAGDSFTHNLSSANPNGGTVRYIVTPKFNGCEGEAREFEITVKPRPEVFAPSTLTICSGENAFIELSASHPDVTYTYTISQNNTAGGFSGEGSVIDQMLETLNEQVGYVTYYITPSLNGCDGETIEVVVRVNPLKNVELVDGFVCFDSQTNLATSTYTIETGLSAGQYSFVWYKDDVILAGELGNSLAVNSSGIYYVEVTNLATGCISVSGFSVVTESYSAESVTAYVNNSFKYGSITVQVVGSGNYLYQLNGGQFQTSNVFANVLPGIQQIVVVDTEGCTYEELEVEVLSYMNFFTPNGDGVHDTWNIWSLSNQDDAEIFIFDRHGKLITQIKPSGNGWDGTYNGVALPSTDYWFKLIYRDGINMDRTEFKSHFSLKR